MLLYYFWTQLSFYLVTWLPDVGVIKEETIDNEKTTTENPRTRSRINGGSKDDENIQQMPMIRLKIVDDNNDQENDDIFTLNRNNYGVNKFNEKVTKPPGTAPANWKFYNNQQRIKSAGK